MLYANKTPLYAAIVQCQKTIDNGTEANREKATDTMDWLVAQLPSGSGIDRGCQLLTVTDSKIVIGFGFHHMDDNGFYCGWTEHKCIIRATLLFGFDVQITGPNKRQIKDYLGETFHHAITAEVWHDKETGENKNSHYA